MTRRWSVSDVLPPPLAINEDAMRTDRMTPARAPDEGADRRWTRARKGR